MKYLERYKKGKLKPQTIERLIRHYDNCMTDDLECSACGSCKHCVKEPDGISCECGCDNFLTKEGCYNFEEDK